MGFFSKSLFIGILIGFVGGFVVAISASSSLTNALKKMLVPNVLAVAVTKFEPKAIKTRVKAPDESDYQKFTALVEQQQYEQAFEIYKTKLANNEAADFAAYMFTYINDLLISDFHQAKNLLGVMQDIDYYNFTLLTWPL
jgi:gas vesicle protein